jgi:hypothetical protein
MSFDEMLPLIFMGVVMLIALRDDLRIGLVTGRRMGALCHWYACMR